MKFSEIQPMCRPDLRGQPIPKPMYGCPFDGLGCIGYTPGNLCGIHDPDPVTHWRAWNGSTFADIGYIKFNHAQIKQSK